MQVENLQNINYLDQIPLRFWNIVVLGNYMMYDNIQSRFSKQHYNVNAVLLLSIIVTNNFSLLNTYFVACFLVKERIHRLRLTKINDSHGDLQ